MTKITLSNYTTEATTIEQQLMDVKEYAAANAKRYGLDLVATMTDQELVEAIGSSKNSQAAIVAVTRAIKALQNAEEPTPAPDPVDEPSPEDIKRAKRAEKARNRRAAKKAAKAD